VATRAFVGRGLPMWIVQRWEDLAEISETQLEVKYAELEHRFSGPSLWMDYWRNLINAGDGDSGS